MRPSIRDIVSALYDGIKLVRDAVRREAIYAMLRAVIDPKPTRYNKLRSEFVDLVQLAVASYLSSSRPVSSYRSDVRNAVTEYFTKAFYRGYVDAGGEETEEEDDNWLVLEVNRQIDFVDSMFDSLKAVRGDVDPDDEANKRAAAWAGTMDGIYNEGKFRGDGNVMLTMKRDPSAPEAQSDPCATCKRWRGKRRSAKKWRADGLLARNGNEAYECGRWEGSCFDEFYLDNGKKYSA